MIVSTVEAVERFTVVSPLVGVVSVVVEVTFFKGETLVDTCEANIGNVIMQRVMNRISGYLFNGCGMVSYNLD